MPVDTTNLAPAVALKYEALEVPNFHRSLNATDPCFNLVRQQVHNNHS